MFKIFLFKMGFFLKKLLALASFMDDSFRNRLNSRNLTVLIKTKNGREAVHYALENGQVKLKGRNHPDPDITITFASGKDACLMLLKPAPKYLGESFIDALIKNDLKSALHAFLGAFKYAPKSLIESSMDALMKDDLKIEFKAESLMWLMTTLQQLMNVFNFKAKKKTAYGQK